MMIDILAPVSEIFNDCWPVAVVDENKLATISGGMSVKEFCKKWTQLSLEKEGNLTRIEVDCIKYCLGQCELSLGMTDKELESYQYNARREFGTTLSKEEIAVIKSNNNKEKEMIRTEEKREKKEIVLSLGNEKTTPVNANSNQINNEEKMFSYTLKCMRELGVNVKIAKGIVLSYFNDKPENETVSVSNKNCYHRRNELSFLNDVLSSMSKRFSIKEMKTEICRRGYSANSSYTYLYRLAKEGIIARVGWGMYEKIS